MVKQSGIKIIKRVRIEAAVSGAAINEVIDNSHTTKNNERHLVRRIGDWVRMRRERRRREEVENLRLYFGDSAVLANVLR